MAEPHGSENEFANITNHTLYSPRYCTGSRPSTTIQITTYLILMTFSLIGNVLVVAVFYRNKTMRTTVHYFIVNMAISDLMIPGIILPRLIYFCYNGDLWLVDGVLGTVLCKLVGITWSVSNWVSLFSMIAIAADRFRAVLFPMKSERLSGKKRLLIIAGTWVASVALRAHYLYAAKVVRRSTGLYCTQLQWGSASYRKNFGPITWSLYISLKCVFGVVLTVLYSSIIVSLNRKEKNLHLATEITKKRARKNRRIAYMLITVVVTFYVVWTPLTVVASVRYLKPSISLPCFFYWFATRFSLLYPVVNPVMYYVFNEKYRKGFRELLCCPWLRIIKCTNCFQPPVAPEGANNIQNAQQVNNHIELQEQ